MHCHGGHDHDRNHRATAHEQHKKEEPAFFFTRSQWLTLGGLSLVGAGYWAYTAGYGSYIWYGLILACPLLHILMMGRGHQHGSSRDTDLRDRRADSDR